MAYEDRHAATKGHKRTVADLMRRAANVDESEEDAPQIQLALLPGMRAPAYLTAKDEEDGGYGVVAYMEAVAEDHRFAIDERRQQVVKISRRADDLETKLQTLEPYMESDSSTTRDALERMRTDRGEAA
jgi:hypothetical protein